MTPYADFLSLGVMLYVTSVTAVSGLIERLRLARFWIVAATAVMLVIIYSGTQTLWHGVTLSTLLLVAAFAALQYGIAAALLVARRRRKLQWAFYLACGLSLVPLAAVKLGGLLAAGDVLGFLGISYLTFRSLDVIICIHDGLITELPPVPYMAYLVFFPTLSSGPIDRFRHFMKDWRHNRTRDEFLSDLDGAVQRLFRGLLYKFILAALIKQYWLDPVSHGLGLLNTLSYMYAYSFYLFFDFAGYSAFAIAFSYVLGIHTPENFKRPFLARNIREFWDRWHITLSHFLRDHVYMRFVMAATKGRWFSQRYLASYIGLALSMEMMALWHGFAPHYLLYGLYHAVLLIGHDVFTRWNKQRQVLQGRLGAVVSVVITFNAVCFGLLIFSGRLT